MTQTDAKAKAKSFALIRKFLYISSLMLFAVGSVLITSPEAIFGASSEAAAEDDVFFANVLGGTFLVVGFVDFLIARFVLHDKNYERISRILFEQKK